MRWKRALLLVLASIVWAGSAARADAGDRFYYLGYEIIQVIDGDTDAIVADIPIKGATREVGLTADRKFLYVAASRHLVHKVDLGANRVVATVDVSNVATLLGQKLTVNEFVAFQNLTNKSVPIVSEKGLLILSIAICGFANFSSVGMQIGGIGALAPERRADIAKLGLKALLCGTLASYLSATLAGIVV